MGFLMRYQIEQKLLPIKTKRRSGLKLGKVRFITDHDTGNDGSTADGNVNYYINSANEDSASAHVFIDDKKILICIPLDEKAWHVRYNVTGDNAIYGDDANDVAIGVELCYSYKRGSINNTEAYKRYVWFLAYLCYTYGLNPIKDNIGHMHLDPKRKTDPGNALQHLGKTFDDLLKDVAAEYKACSGNKVPDYTTATPAPTVLRKGDKGTEVRKLQVKLNKLGYSILVDGDFGAGTDSAVRAFQTSSKVAVDGVVGKDTMAAIDAAVAAKANSLIEEDDTLKLSAKQVDVLVDSLTKLKAAGAFTSDEWINKAKDGTLTVSELAWLNIVITQRGWK